MLGIESIRSANKLIEDLLENRSSSIAETLDQVRFDELAAAVHGAGICIVMGNELPEFEKSNRLELRAYENNLRRLSPELDACVPRLLELRDRLVQQHLHLAKATAWAKFKKSCDE